MDESDLKPDNRYRYFVQVVNGTEIPNEPLYFIYGNEELSFDGVLIPNIVLRKAMQLVKGSGIFVDGNGNETQPF